MCAQETLGMSLLKRVIRGFDRLDTLYIEPQHYNLTMMMQATYTLDQYTIASEQGQEVTLSPDPKTKVGPYLGWRWFFAGYTFDLKNLGFNNNGQKRELDLSIYSSQIGIDLFYRRTGSDYKLRSIDLGEDVDTRALEGVPFDGVSAGVTGVNVYYIFNHGRFSYPAAFSQSTLQKRSCGSWIAGVGYTRNSLDLDYEKLQKTFDLHLGKNVAKVDTSLYFNQIRYTDYTLSGGYAWNQVLPHHWLLAASGQLGLAYKKSTGDVEGNAQAGFNFENVNLDAVGRFGVVYNNMRWYAGMSAIIRTNNYHKPRFRTNNTFGNVNLYIGYNFGLKGKYRKKM
jgi:hypothetical protein